jgi:coenzyme Q-binding protein COQ10
MPRHFESRTLPYGPERMFDLVADIESYPQFLPWCVGARILARRGNVVEADLMVGFRMLRETFTSEVTLVRPERIDVRYTRGPLRYLHNQWLFSPEGAGCRIDFDIDFEFRSRLLRKMMEPLFHEAVRRMVQAFSQRAAALYDEPRGAKPRPSAS